MLEQQARLLPSRPAQFLLMLSTRLERIYTRQYGVAVALYVCMCWGGSVLEGACCTREQHFIVCHNCAVGKITWNFVVFFAKRHGIWSFMPLFIHYTRTESDRRVEIST
jgi:hypothetical protein